MIKKIDIRNVLFEKLIKIATFSFSLKIIATMMFYVFNIMRTA